MCIPRANSPVYTEWWCPEFLSSGDVWLFFFRDAPFSKTGFSFLTEKVFQWLTGHSIARQSKSNGHDRPQFPASAFPEDGHFVCGSQRDNVEKTPRVASMSRRQCRRPEPAYLLLILELSSQGSSMSVATVWNRTGAALSRLTLLPSFAQKFLCGVKKASVRKKSNGFPKQSGLYSDSWQLHDQEVFLGDDPLPPVTKLQVSTISKE